MDIEQDTKIIEIDPKSGFCFGVINAIQQAEKALETHKTLYCLGDIVHNGAEVARLNTKGLTTITHEDFKNFKNCTVLLRAHGEPPETYQIAKENNIPIAFEFPAGHQKDNRTLILGKKVDFEVNENEIILRFKD